MFKIFKKIQKIKYNFNGGGNRIKIIKEDGQIIWNPKSIPGLTIDFRGSNGYLEIWEPCIWDKSYFMIGDNSSIVVKKINALSLSIHSIAKVNIFIDEYTSFWNVDMWFQWESNISIIIGKDCMLSSGVNLWPSDAHVIFDKNNNIINRPKNKSIIIGDHVWIGYGSTILKNTKIPSGCIIGAGSIVTGKFNHPNSIIAGSGSNLREVKYNINWDRRSIYLYEQDQSSKSKGH